ARPHQQRGRAQEGVDGIALGLGGLGVQQPEVHYLAPASPCAMPAAWRGWPFAFSTRTAVALNSAVPDFGSVASIVRMLTLTWPRAGKRQVRKPSPGRTLGSPVPGASTEPRRELIRASSPGSSSSSAASWGDRSSVSPRRRGDAYRPDCTPVL